MWRWTGTCLGSCSRGSRQVRGTDWILVLGQLGFKRVRLPVDISRDVEMDWDMLWLAAVAVDR